MFRNKAVLSVALIAALLWIVPAGAQAGTIGVGTEIGVDFSDIQGVGTNYNLFTTPSTTIPAGSVIDTSGDMVDGVTVSLGAIDLGGGGAGWMGPPTGSLVPSFPDEVRGDVVYGDNPLEVTFGGLDPNLKYNLIAASSWGNDGTDVSTTVTVSGLVGGDQSSSMPRHWTAEHVFNDIQPDVGGQIILSVTDAGQWNQPTLNGVLLTAVPEPSTLALTGLGLLSLAFVARRRRR